MNMRCSEMIFYLRIIIIIIICLNIIIHFFIHSVHFFLSSFPLFFPLCTVSCNSFFQLGFGSVLFQFSQSRRWIELGWRDLRCDLCWLNSDETESNPPWPVCSISVSVSHVSHTAYLPPSVMLAAPPSADALAAGCGAAERSLSLPQHQTGQRTGQCVSAPRPRVQQVPFGRFILSVFLQMIWTRSDVSSVSNSSESTSIVLIFGSTLD